MNKKYIILIAFSFLIITLTSFYFGTQHSNAFNHEIKNSSTEKQQEIKHSTTPADIPSDQPQEPEPIIDVSFIKPQIKTDKSFIEVQGKVNSGKSLSISSIADGKIVKTNISIGQNVVKGQTVAEINNQDSQTDFSALKNKLEINKNTISNLENKLKDYQDMLKAGIVARNDVLTIKNDINTKKVENEDIKLSINKLNIRKSNNIIKSPYSGYVSDVMAEGSFVTYGQSIATIIPVTEQYIEAQIPSENLKSIKTGQEVIINDNNKGFISNISPVSSFNMIKAVVKTNMPLTIGLDMQLKILTKISKGVTIPKSCIVIQDGKTSVFIVKGNKAVLQEVEIEKDDNTNVIISKGLNIKDKVVVKNASLLSDGTEVKIK